MAETVKPFVLASSLAPILVKLLSKIQALPFVATLPFVAMRELLPDITLLDYLEALPGLTGVVAYGKDPPKQREVPSLLTWVAC